MPEQHINAADHLPLVEWVINKRFSSVLPYIEHDDLLQIGSIGLIKAARSFDPGKGRFSSYAVRCIANEILMEMRKGNKMPPKSETVSLDQSLSPDSDLSVMDVIASPGFMDDEVLIRIVAHECASGQNDLKKLIINHLINGENGAEISRKLGISKSYAFRVIKEFRKQLTELLYEQNNTKEGM